MERHGMERWNDQKGTAAPPNRTVRRGVGVTHRVGLQYCTGQDYVDYCTPEQKKKSVGQGFTIDRGPVRPPALINGNVGSSPVDYEGRGDDHQERHVEHVDGAGKVNLHAMHHQGRGGATCEWRRQRENKQSFFTHQKRHEVRQIAQAHRGRTLTRRTSSEIA